jgi:kynurenine 3-monooxygenase
VLLHRLFPRWYLPLYTLVTFTRTPYAEALRRVRRQDLVVRVVFVFVGVAVLLGVFLLLWGR